MNNDIEILGTSALFQNIEKSAIEAFVNASTLYRKEYKKGQFITFSGEPMEGLGVLLEGDALLTRENALGERSIMTDLTAGHIFGEALLFTTHPLWPATVQAKTKATVLFIPLATFTTPMHGLEACQNQLLINLLQNLSEKAIVLYRKVHYLTLKSMRHKLFAYFQDLYKNQRSSPLQLPHKRQELADLLNVSRPSMSRELGRLVKENILLVTPRTIEILNYEAVGIPDERPTVKK